MSETQITVTQEKTMTFSHNGDVFTYWHLKEIVRQMEQVPVPPEATITINKNGGIAANWFS